MPFRKATSLDIALDTFESNLEAPASDIGRLPYYQRRGFHPHVGQQKAVTHLDNGVRNIFVVSGKRGGKTVLVREEAIYQSVELGRKVWVAGPTWDTVDAIFLPIWQEVERNQIELLDKNKERRIFRTRKGGSVRGISWGAPEQIEAEAVHLLITDESQQMTEVEANLFQARLVGDYTWVWIGSPAVGGMSFFEERAEIAQRLEAEGLSYAYVTWPTWVNPNAEIQQVVNETQEEIIALDKTLGPEHPFTRQRRQFFRSVYGAESLPPVNIAIPSFNKEVHVQDCPFDEHLPVTLWVDPGFWPGAYVVLATQQHLAGSMMKLKLKNEPEVWIIDEIYANHVISPEVISIARGRPWWDNVTNVVMDVAGRQIDRQTGRSEVQVWFDSTRIPVATQYVNIAEGLEVHRRWLFESRLFHDRAHTPFTQTEYRRYRLNDKRDAPIDKDNHAMKAIAYGLINRFGVLTKLPKTTKWEAYTRDRQRGWW